MAVSIVPMDLVLNETVPLWLEVSLALAAAVALATAKAFQSSKTLKSGRKVADACAPCMARASAKLCQTIETEVVAGNSEAALKAWRFSKERGAVSLDTLPHLVRAYLDADPDALKAEILEHMRENSALLATQKAASLVLDMVARSGNAQLLEELSVAFQQDLRIPRGNAMNEALLSGFALAGCKRQVDELLAQMRESKQKVTARSFALMIKGFLRSGLIDDGIAQICEMRKHGLNVPSFAVVELFRAARDADRSAEVLHKTQDMVHLNADAVTILLEDCLGRMDRALAEHVQNLASGANLTLTVAAMEALLRLYASAGDTKALELFEEMQRSGSLRFSEGFCVGILTRCADAKFLRLAERLVRYARSQDGGMTVTIYSAFMKVYAFCGLFKKACDLHEQLCADGLEPDAIMYGCLLKFATECGNTDLMKKFSDKVDASDVHHCMSLMRAAGSEGNLDRAFEHFEKLKATCDKPDVVIFNCLIDVCINAGDMRRARVLLDDMRSIGIFDKISYNTIMKGYCAQGDTEGAKACLQEMEAAGFQPNDITFNSLINMAGSSGNLADAWAFIREMQRRDIPLDKYTICTMLKSMRRSGSSHQDTIRVLDLLDQLDLEICGDEVLMNIVLDTCIRQSERQRVEVILTAYEKSNLRPVSHTYSSLIRAYSSLNRMQRCREIWTEMVQTRGMEINNIVFGCMLDALVCSGCVEEAFDLFNKHKGHAAGNSVIYSTLMKGFANSHLPDQAMSLFHEMRSAGIQPTTTSYNAVADAQARVGNSNAVQKLMELMKKDQCKPDHVTHSIVVKAYCVSGELEQAFQAFQSMQLPEAGFSSRSGAGSRDGSVTIAFNTLLDGCIKHNRMELADSLLEKVEEFGVQPTNFTLSILLKMCGRRRQLHRAMRAVDTWPKLYKFTPNSAVMTCLMSTCLKNDSLDCAFKVFEDVKAAGYGDARAYGVLLTGCVRRGALDRAVHLVEEAYGLNRNDGYQPGRGLDMQLIEQLFHALVQQGLGRHVGVPLLRRLHVAGAPMNERLFAMVVE